MANELLERYAVFVDGVMSEDSKDLTSFIDRLRALDTESDVRLATLITAGLGISGEAGEVADLVKKIIFHGKPLTDELRASFVKESGDVVWYIAALCLALDVPLEEVITKNIEKLVTRYPGGTFSVERSENRVE